MTISDLAALALALLFFGGTSGTFVFVCTRLILQHLRERGFFVEVGDGRRDDW